MMIRRNRLRRAALVLALLVLAAIVTGVAESAAKTVVPKQLTGSWSRLGPPGADQITVSPRGKVTRDPLGTDYSSSRFSRVTAHRLSISGPASITGPGRCSRTGTYRWTIAKIPYGDIYKPGHQLTLTKIHDTCKPRVGLFSGRWSN
jgi:hypothetical protein